jgi:hypothetical protein
MITAVAQALAKKNAAPVVTTVARQATNQATKGKET